MSRASGFKRSSDSDETFTQAAWDAAKDAEELLHGRVEVLLTPSKRRGVWNVTVRLQNCNEHDIMRTFIVLVGDYPNSRAAALSSFLYAEMNKMLLMAAQKHAIEVGLVEPRR